MKCYENYLTLALKILISNSINLFTIFVQKIKINLLNSQQKRLYFKKKLDNPKKKNLQKQLKNRHFPQKQYIIV